MADDATVVRDVRVALRHATGCRVAATVDGRFSARARLSELRPDIVLVDEMCQRTNAFARLREVSEAVPGAKAVLLCGAMDRALVDDALASGADAVLSRRLHPTVLGTLLRSIADDAIVHLPPAPAQWPGALARTSA